MAERRVPCAGCGRPFAPGRLNGRGECIGCETREEARALGFREWVGRIARGEDPGPEPETPRLFASLEPEDRQSWLARIVSGTLERERARDEEQARQAAAAAAARPATLRDRVIRAMWGEP